MNGYPPKTATKHALHTKQIKIFAEEFNTYTQLLCNVTSLYVRLSILYIYFFHQLSLQKVLNTQVKSGSSIIECQLTTKKMLQLSVIIIILNTYSFITGTDGQRLSCYVPTLGPLDKFKQQTCSAYSEALLDKVSKLEAELVRYEKRLDDALRKRSGIEERITNEIKSQFNTLTKVCK